MVDGASQTITIRNNSQKITATNIISNLASTSLAGNVDETRNGCDNVLPNASCTFTYTPHSTLVPATTVTYKGSNTSAVVATIAISNKPQISVTGPIQQLRTVPVGAGALTLQITNDPASVFNANGITVTDKTACPNVVVDDSNCQSVSLAPGASCNLSLSAPAGVAYAPCTITIAGNNTLNTNALIACIYMGGLVFEGNGVTGKIFVSTGGSAERWIFPDVNTGAFSTTDGASNTVQIEAVGSCNSGSCAARNCTTQAPQLYLPAIGEWTNIHDALCSNNALPCNFGNFSGNYWSSTQSTTNISNASSILFPGGSTNPVESTGSVLNVECVMNF